MVQIIPAAQPRPKMGQRLGQALMQGIEQIKPEIQLMEENKALKSRGIDVSGIRDPETRSQIIAHELKYGAKKKAIEATQERGYGSHGNKNASELTPITKKEKLPGFIVQDGIEPKKGLYTQKTTQGELQPIRSSEQLQQDGIQFARNANSIAGQTIMSDQDGIAYENEKNNLAIQSNERIQGDQRALQSEKSAFNQKGRAEAINTIDKDNLTPEVASYFGKKAENLASEVNSDSELDQKLAQEITNYKKTVAIAKNSVNEPPQNAMGDDSLGEKVIGDLKKKLDPLLKMGLYDKARDILSEKGYGPEQRETVISNLPDSVNKVLAGIPRFRTNQKLGHPRQAAAVVREYSNDQKEVINNAMSQIFKADPSTNITLLRKRMRDELNIDWRGFKDGLDYAIDTGALPLEGDNLDQYSRMSEPEESGLQQILRVFGIGGR